MNFEQVRNILGQFQQGNRHSAWEQALELLPPGDSTRRRATRFLRTVQRYEALQRWLDDTPVILTLPPSPKPNSGPHRPSHKPPRHLRVKGKRPRSLQRWRARLSWSNLRWQDPLVRAGRMAPCHTARRQPKDRRLLAEIHPHIRAVMGDKELLRQMGRS